MPLVCMLGPCLQCWSVYRVKSFGHGRFELTSNFTRAIFHLRLYKPEHMPLCILPEDLTLSVLHGRAGQSAQRGSLHNGSCREGGCHGATAGQPGSTGECLTHTGFAQFLFRFILAGQESVVPAGIACVNEDKFEVQNVVICGGQ